MNIEQLYRDFNVPYATEGHRHCRPGWVQTPCPFCIGNPGMHLGYNTENERFVCWRCGGHWPEEAISRLLNIGKAEASKLLYQYGTLARKAPESKRKIRVKQFRLPDNITALQKNHKDYLIKRDFEPSKLEKDWHIEGTGVSALLDKINYKHRIIIPFFWGSKLVSFDSRDITGKAMNKYQACPAERELIEHKRILYGRQDKWTNVGICVEGPTDVWRIGVNSFATSGIKYTGAQLRVISKTFTRVPVLYDDDPQAIVQANKLVADLKFRGVDAFRVDIKGDPGAMSQEEADYLVKQLI